MVSTKLSPTSTIGALINALFCALLVIILVVMGFTMSPMMFVYAGIAVVLDGVFWSVFLRARRQERQNPIPHD